MLTVYTLFQFLHVAAVIVWVGGVCTLNMLNLRLLRAGDKRDKRDKRDVLPMLEVGGS